MRLAVFDESGQAETHRLRRGNPAQQLHPEPCEARAHVFLSQMRTQNTRFTVTQETVLRNFTTSLSLRHPTVVVPPATSARETEAGPAMQASAATPAPKTTEALQARASVVLQVGRLYVSLF
jgi:hypothetical protein